MNDTKYLLMSYVFAIIFLVGIQLLLPKLSRRGLVLGVSFPESVIRKDVVKKEVLGYKKMTTIFGLLLILIMSILVWLFPDYYIVHLVIITVLTLLMYYPVYHFNKKLRKVKAELGINDGPEKVVVDMNLSRNKLTAFSSGLHLYWIPALMIMAASIYIIGGYDKYPSSIPTHYNFKGEADIFSVKTMNGVLLPVYLMVFLFLTMFFTNVVILNSKQRLDPANPQASLTRFIKARKIWTYYLVAMTIFLYFITLVPMVYTMRFGITEAKFLSPLILGGTLIILTTSIYIALKVGTVGERLKIGETKDNRPSPAGTEGDDKYWKLGGLIYNNPEDPSVFVAKRIGIGYTINLVLQRAR